MTEVGHADLSRLLQSKRNECHAIVTSRKRKLRELFAVATQTQPLPQQAHALPDAPIATTAEWQFLHKNDILQERIFDESTIPQRPAQSVEALKRSISAQLAAANSPANSPVATTPGTSNSTTSARSTPGVQSPANIQNGARPAVTTQLSAAAPVARAQNHASQRADASRRPSQVSFPPGTKGSPSLTPTPVTNGVPAVAPAADGSLSIKLPPDAAKVTDAMSSPGSTAASATTTAAHDVSANTSPDHEGPRSPEVEQQPAQAALKPETKQIATGQKPQTSDEDQLLQESIRSAAASGSEDEVSATTAPSSKPQTTISVPSAKEVPDSQDEADKMDVDEQETIKDSIDVNPTPPLLTPQTTRETVPAERAVTRVSSGAMRLKSVNEIVGATPLTPSASAPASPAARSKSRKDRSKGQASTVLFGKQPKRVEDKSLAPGQKEQFHPFDDYYTPLFIQNFTGATNWMQPIEKILFHANKTIGTSDANLAILDNQACKVLRRVYHLQQHDKWSLRQLKRCPEPTRPSSHWDLMLQEMKWMRTDFREERKWKMTVARNLAYACVEWHESNAEDRLALQVVARIPPKPCVDGQDTQMGDDEAAAAENHPTPDLEPSGDLDTPLHDDISEGFVETVAPSAIFSLQEDDVVFGLRRTQAAQQLLNELPLYGAPLKVPPTDLGNPELDPDAHWRRPALPLSKFVEGEMRVVTKGPPLKRGRFNFRNEDSDDEGDSTFAADPTVNYAGTDDMVSNVALFNPESKAIRDRLHAGHQFRPPSEHPMPMQSFYECRSASQWTISEDDDLRGLVRDYSYNWSLISCMLSTRSSFISGPERRTPWECFERWINLEGLPADMQKTQYFKAYSTRIEAAQRVIAQQNQIAAQQASAAGNNMPAPRRRPSVPVRVERRRNQKHLTLIDAMRKLAKKRETAQQKQQHAASQNAVKKAAETVTQRPSKTPRDYSLMRFERDQALAEKMAQYAARQEASRRAQIQARAQTQAVQMAGAAQAAQPNQAAAQAAAAAAAGVAQSGAQRPEVPPHMVAAAAAAAAGQRPRMPSQSGVNGAPQAAPSLPSQMSPAMVAAAAQMKGIPAAQLQAALQAQAQQHRMPMPNQQADTNLMLRAQQISNQQRAVVQIQQQQQVHHQQQRPNAAVPQNGQGSPPMHNGMNGINQQPFMNNAQAMMATYNTNNANRNGGAGSGMHLQNGVPNGSPGPRIPTQLPPNIALQLSQLEAQFRAKNPSLTPEQSRQLATEHLTRAMMAQRQSALNAAAGVTVQPGLANSIAATTSPHQYAALLRQQQQQQAAAAAASQQKQQQQQQQTSQQAQQVQQQHQQQPQQQQQAQVQQLSGNNAVGSPLPPAVHQRQSSGSATPSSTGK
ncbi:large tegument protein [Cordyceps militaris CM01]|uniref:Vacuolar import and degradation protein 21 n=1 Tax=Cordyceps militaris (strain CM01) TaxID=983644 RepID=G3JQ45_CORMM|nr:large tegument protein [Cordyceps militaris CM01]EGX89296.1 large tegument protein [Cordyceps militaris CM01]